MAERPSVQEILARVRAAGPARPGADPGPTSPPPAAAEEPGESVPASEAPAASSSPPPSEPPPTSAPLGRPMTLKEKLAAARGRPAGSEPAGTASVPAAAAPTASAPASPEIGHEEPSPPAPPAPSRETLGRPLTLQEKLAAARSGGAGAAARAAKPSPRPAASPATSPAARAASSRAVPPLEQATDPRDLAEHLRRAGAEQAKKAQGSTAKAAPTSKAAPRKAESKVVPPRPGREVAVSATSRRGLLRVGFWIAAGWAAFTAGMATLLAGSARFFFPNVLAEPPSTIKVGSPGDFEKGQVEERWKAEWGFWIVRSDAYDGEDKIYALSSICTHLGCPPNWLASEQKFKCPCHGSGFYISGVNFEGPAPRPLERYKLTLGDDGQLVVDKSQKYQEELGQWTDPESYFKV